MKITLKAYYAPCIEYFSLILKAKKVFIDTKENYQKQSYRNRCYILNSQGIQKLIIPVVDNHKKTLIKDIKIDNRVSWNKSHWRAIETAYGKAPYFIHYEKQIAELYNKKYTFLVDLNLCFLEMFLKILKISIPISFTSQYDDYALNLDLPKKNLLSNKIETVIIPRYQQVFGEKFIQNLSIIDLLMCYGPRLDILY